MSKILSINAGSSSLKFTLFTMPQEEAIASGIVERIGLKDGIFSIKFNGEKETINQPIPDHRVAAELVLNGLVEHKIVADLQEIVGVGHRVVHGGELYNKTVIFDEEVEKSIEDLADLAPLHNPANLIGYRGFKKALPNALHTAIFDTAFHQTMEEDIYLYPIPYEYYTDYGVRRYGFHGTSHQFVSHKVAELMGKKADEVNVITLHLGNGASITAVENGKSVNTSMGFTPLAGIMMGTRSGDIDPSIITYLMEKTGLSAVEMVDIYNKKSGMLGVSGISSDARDLGDAVKAGNERAKITEQLYANRVAQTVGSYFVQLGHVDAMVFTGGIGENDAVIREEILKRLEEAMGLQIDYELNASKRAEDIRLSLDNSKTQVWLIPTDEELVIARDTYAFLNV
ncbi:MAG TPA: acetate kinase [Erysipelothrix sp.]|jgi:acetate kinase|nr:acetate kinase [Erysipelothrix sp.]